MWFGWSSRVLFPDRKTDESLSKVSFPSGDGYDFARSVRMSSCAPFGSMRNSFGGKRPFVTVIAEA